MAHPLYEPALALWHDFYMLSGSTSAALLGLLFVQPGAAEQAHQHERRAKPGRASGR